MGFEFNPWPHSDSNFRLMIYIQHVVWNTCWVERDGEKLMSGKMKPDRRLPPSLTCCPALTLFLHSWYNARSNGCHERNGRSLGTAGAIQIIPGMHSELRHSDHSVTLGCSGHSHTTVYFLL